MVQLPSRIGLVGCDDDDDDKNEAEEIKALVCLLIVTLLVEHTHTHKQQALICVLLFHVNCFGH